MIISSIIKQNGKRNQSFWRSFPDGKIPLPEIIPWATPSIASVEIKFDPP